MTSTIPILQAMEELLTPSRVAELLGVSVNTLGYWRRTGQGPVSIRIGANSIRYAVSDIEK